MLLEDKVYLGTSTKPEYLTLKYANRHGIVTGATGTGKTRTITRRIARGKPAARQQKYVCTPAT